MSSLKHLQWHTDVQDEGNITVCLNCDINTEVKHFKELTLTYLINLLFWFLITVCLLPDIAFCISSIKSSLTCSSISGVTNGVAASTWVSLFKYLLNSLLSKTWKQEIILKYFICKSETYLHYDVYQVHYLQHQKHNLTRCFFIA